MPVTTGNMTKAVLVKGATWGTEVAPAATDAIEILAGSAASAQKPPFMAENSDQPTAKSTALQAGLVTAGGQLQQVFRFDDLRIAAYALGIGTNYSTPAEQTVGESDYLHEIVPASDIDGLFFSHAQLHGSDLQVVTSGKSKGFTLSGNVDQDQSIKIVSEYAAHNAIWNSAIVEAADFATLTYPTRVLALMDMLQVRINDATGSALAAGDKIAIKSFSFKYARILNTGLYDNESVPYIIEPVNDGLAFDAIQLTLGFNYFSAATKQYVIDHMNLTPKKIDLIFTGPQIGSGDNYSLKLEIPYAVVVDTGDTGSYSGSGLLPASVTFNIVRPPDALTAGMLFADAFKLSVTNMQSAKAVA